MKDYTFLSKSSPHWKEIHIEQLEAENAELNANYSRVQFDVAKVYMEITGGKCSKETTPASVVIGLYQEHLNSLIEAENAELRREVIEAASDESLLILRDDFDDNGDLLPAVATQ